MNMEMCARMTPSEETTPVIKREISKPVVLMGVVAGCLVFFTLTSPKAVPSVMLFAGFIVLATLLASIIKLFLIITGLERRLPVVYRRGILIGGTALPVLLLMLQSIGQLTIRDVLTLGILFLLSVFYASRIGRIRS
jgi:hypothetical protein